MMDKVFNKPVKDIGRGIIIGDLVGFNTNHNTDNHPKIRPDDVEISEVNDKSQPQAPQGHNELKQHFIFDHQGERKDANEIQQN